MNLRPMTQEDLPEVQRIQSRITRQEVPQSWMDMLAAHVNKTYRLGFVAEEGGTVLGFLLGEIKIGGFGTELSGWLELLGVEPKQMGSGVGAALVETLFKALRGRGVREIYTAVRWDSGDMLAFFKKIGFDKSPFINLRFEQTL
ncbi:MAG: GNAT family N-acetyltransferase [Proteobacteria bacterium]|nr:GNAT family N-acetyltransferase [Pseudomonadota bacterium]MBU4383070.1 GNAT family N-acetyltransferase [Pseudomonadota bacterium]MBU4605166.1 GNAT family N-acetyltransferase [Pseudomonadota bacterium]MCG2762826.1 GNAT family N-acetyltransferase [Desulfarculaceae bacterium]